MGMSVGGGRKSGRGRRGVPRYGAMADINMTPFIDVMLVLLIIFMVAAPLLTSGVAGRSAAGQGRRRSTSTRSRSRIAINDQGQLFLMDQPVADGELVAKLQALGGDGCRPAHLSARRQGRDLWARRRDHGPGDDRRLQEGRARHRAGQAVRRGFGVSEQPSKTGLIISGAMHGALLAFILFGFARAPKFDDAAESIPVDTVTQTQFNEIMKGEKDAQAGQRAASGACPRGPAAARSADAANAADAAAGAEDS